MALVQYLESNPQGQYDPTQQLSTCCPGPAGNATLVLNWNKSQTVASRENDFSLSLCLLDTLGSFLCLFGLAQTLPRYKRTWGSGNFLETPLQFSSMLVKLQKRSQQGDFGTQLPTASILPVCLSTLLPGIIGIIVRLALRTNRASSWRARAVSLKGHVSGGAPGDTQHASTLDRQLAW